jgi:hypothetical protein
VWYKRDKVFLDHESFINNLKNRNYEFMEFFAVVSACGWRNRLGTINDLWLKAIWSYL